MRRTGLRAPLLALAPALVLVLSLVPTSSDIAPPEPSQPATASAASLGRQGLAFWMAGRPAHLLCPGGLGGPGELVLPCGERAPRGVVSAADLAAALRQAGPRQLVLFDRGEAAAQHEVLRRLPYGSVLARVCDRNHVDSLLVAAVVEAESQFEANAVSPEGAVGLMQLLPSTGQEYGVRDLFDPAANLDAGSRYLGGLLNRFRGDRELAVAAYNAGPEVVARLGRVPPFRETQGFVRRVMSSYQAHHERIAAMLMRPLPSAPVAAARGGTRLARNKAPTRRLPARDTPGTFALGR